MGRHSNPCLLFADIAVVDVVDVNVVDVNVDRQLGGKP